MKYFYLLFLIQFHQAPMAFMNVFLFIISNSIARELYS